jgi:hypothetical protein
MTAGSGALYWSSDRVTLANYNASGLVVIEANGGAAVATFGGATYNNDFVGTGRFSNNLSIGATLSAWISSAKVLQLNNTAALYAPTDESILSNNVFVDSGDNNKYITTNFASQYRQVSGQHLFYSAASGTAGNTISFGTPKLAITSGGNVGIGTSSPNATAANRTVLDLNGSLECLFAFSNGGTLRGYIYHNASTSLYVTEGARNMEFSTTGAGFMGFGTNNTERMRIATDGQILMNTSSPLTAGWLCIAVASDNYNAIVLKDTGTSYSTANYYQVFTNSSNGIAGAIMHLTASTIGLFTGPSDQRLKSNIKDVKESVLPLFNDVKLKTFNHIADNDESVVYKGFLAQDMVDKFPEAYGLDKEGYYAFNPNGYVPYLVKAISELKAEIEELKNK